MVKLCYLAGPGVAVNQWQGRAWSEPRMETWLPAVGKSPPECVSWSHIILTPRHVPTWPVDAALLVPEDPHHGLHTELALPGAGAEQLGALAPPSRPHLRQLEMFLTPLVTLSATQKMSAVSRTQASVLSAIRKELW